MKPRLLARSVYLSIALIVTMAVGGCIPVAIPVPVTKHLDPIKPDAMPAGATKGATKGKIIEKFSFPEAKTFDGRFFLYTHRWENHWMWLVGVITPWFADGEAYHTPGRDKYAKVLIEFDNHDIFKRYAIHNCKTNTTDARCGVRERALWAMIKKLLGKDRAAQYREALTRTESLAKPLYEAVERADLAGINRLIGQGADVMAADLDGGTLLHQAASEGHTAVVELLLAKGADVMAAGLDGGTPLHQAASKGHTAVVELLIAKGADVNAWKADAGTPLHQAASEGHIAVVELLSIKGADVNAWSADTGTPLHQAASKGHTAVVELLLAKKGVHVNARDGNGNTPLRSAVERPIADIQNVAGKWRGKGRTADGHDFSITLIINEDGSYEAKARWSSGSLAGEGTMRIIDGKLRWKSGSTGLDITTILYEGKKGKRMLKTRRTDGLTFKVKQSKQSKKSAKRKSWYATKGKSEKDKTAKKKCAHLEKKNQHRCLSM